MRESPNGKSPTVVEVRRGAAVESWHRGSWVLVDAAGTVLDGAGDLATPVFVRSAVKSLQALPLLESGAAERFAFDDADLALALASHSGEPCHTERVAAILERVAAILERLGLGVDNLRCGAHPPFDAETRRELEARGEEPTALHNNCSGKHAGFLALALHLGVPAERYLDPESAGQSLVREALGAMCDLDPGGLETAIDGCSAPTFRVPLPNLATGLARLATPDRLDAERAACCRRLTEAARAHPHLIAGSHGRLCTALSRATGGRLFPKIGAEGVYVIGACGADRGLAVKMEDGGKRGLHALVMALVERLGWADEDALEQLHEWRDPTLTNHRGLEVGRLEVRLP